MGLFIFFCPNAWAQFENDYSPIKYDDKKAKELIKALQNQNFQKTKELKPGNPSDDQLAQYFDNITKDLVRQVRNEQIICNDSLQRYLNEILRKLTANNLTNSIPVKLLIARKSEVNARCVGEGTILLNNGLLAKIEQEEELAFIIAHELAHFELKHVDLALRNKYNMSNVFQPKKHGRKITYGKSSLEGIENIKNLAYILSMYSRKNESEADSLAYLLFKSAYGHHKAPLQTINTLDSAMQPWYSFDSIWFENLGFTDFPFQHHWTKEQINHYSKEQKQYLFFNLDSLRSHPEFNIRRENLKNLIKLDSIAKKKEEIPNMRPNKFQVLTQFENVNTCINEKKFNYALFYAFQLKSIYPKNAYIDQIIPYILMEVFKLERDGTLKYNLSRYTIGYSQGLRQVTNFLLNVPAEVIIEMAYHWLNNQSNFNRSKEGHFYVLWQICRETQRKKVQQRIEEKYLELHRGGRYTKEMKLSLW